MWLHEILKDKIEDARNRLQRVKQEYSDQTVSEVKVKHLFNGLRGADLLISQISHVAPQEGVQFYDYSVEQVQPQPGGKSAGYRGGHLQHQVPQPRIGAAQPNVGLERQFRLYDQ